MPRHVPRLPPTVVGKSGALMMYFAAEVANPIAKTAYELPTPTVKVATVTTVYETSVV